ncbi:MAG: hypothetical protein L0271_22635 [Gemmatimonadetes bacterium]|nr:hypothetical protein [Gemmatimonadota bacterium]
MPAIPTPSWLLLFWCGLSAALASELFAAALRPARASRRRGHPSSPQLVTGPRENLPIAVLTGTLLLAPIYGVIFELLEQAQLLNGAVIGGIHGLLVTILATAFAVRPAVLAAQGKPDLRAVLLYRLRRLIARVAYGALFGFLYVVPVPPA